MTTTTTFEKSIRYNRATHDYKGELDGRLIGFYPNYHAAEQALDNAAYDMLIHSDCATTELDDGSDLDTVQDELAAMEDEQATQVFAQPQPDEDAPVCSCGALATWEVPFSTVPTHEYFCNACYAATHYLGDRISADPPIDIPDEPYPPTPGGPEPPTYSPRCVACQTAAFPASSLIANICVACANARYFGLRNRFAAARETELRARTRLDVQIETTMRRCHNCGDAHFGWQCPDVRTRLFAAPKPAPWCDAALGRELCRMRWHNFQGFVALLLSVPTAHLVIYAASYIAFMHSHNPQTDVTTSEVLGVWTRLIAGGDRAPAAPARRLAA